MKIWAKKSFYIHRSSHKMFIELPIEEKPGHYTFFEKDLPYEAKMFSGTYLISDWIKQVVLSESMTDNLFEKEEDRITRLRNEKLRDLLNY